MTPHRQIRGGIHAESLISWDRSHVYINPKQGLKVNLKLTPLSRPHATENALMRSYNSEFRQLWKVDLITKVTEKSTKLSPLRKRTISISI